MDERSRRQMRRQLYNALEDSDGSLALQILDECKESGYDIGLDQCSVTENRRRNGSPSGSDDSQGVFTPQSVTFMQLALMSEKPLELVKLLVAAGADRDSQNNEGYTAVSLACALDKPKLVEIMIKTCKADVNIPNINGLTPLMIACAQRNPKVAQLLLSVADINIDYTDNKGNSALHYTVMDTNGSNGSSLAAQMKLVDMLARHGCDVNQVNKERLTPVMISAQRGQDDIIQTLLLAGCDLCCQNIEKCTALMFAVRNHHTSTVRLLLQNGADLSMTDSKKVTPLYCAVRDLHEDIINLILSTPQGLRTINMSDSEGTTPILEAVKASCLQGLFAVRNTSTCGRIIRTLLDKGCDVNQPQQIMGWTALYCAALISNLELAQLLIDYGADVNQRDKVGDNALMSALNTGKSKPEMIKLFIQQGADVNNRNISGANPLYMSIVNHNPKEVTEMLLDSGSDMEAVERVKKRTALHAAVECRLPGSQLVVGDSEAALMLIDRGCNINHTDAEGTTPLTKAIQNGNSFVVERLLKHPNVDVSLGTRNIPLHTAVHKTDEGFIRRLVQLGADINRTNSAGFRPIQIAVEANQRRIIKCLLSLGCRLDVTETHRDLIVPKSCCIKYHDQHPHTELQPLFAAVKFDDIEMFKMLLNYYHRKPYSLIQTLHDMLTIAFDSGNRAQQMLSTEGRKLLLELFREELSLPSSLLELCRGTLRRHIGVNVILKVQSLSLPTQLKHYLLLDTERHLDLADLNEPEQEY